MSAEKEKMMIDLSVGGPGGDVIKDVCAMMLDATKAVLHENADAYDLFKYGADGGDIDCKERVAQFLSLQYGASVPSDSLILTAGATHGLHFLLTTLMASSSIVFMEDPSYFFVIPMIRDDLLKTIVPVSRDEEGMIPEVFENLLSAHKPSGWQRTESGPQYWASVYFVPTFNNPTGQSYSDARLRQLVTLARKHGVLLIAEDLYRFLPFSEDSSTPSLLLTFDPVTDPDYCGGHLVTNTSFSKLLGAGLRFGWIEGPAWLIKKVTNNYVSKSGGSFNHYMSKLVSQLISTGREQDHIRNIRKIYKNRMAAFVQTMIDNLPEGCSFDEPKGGFYLWITLRPGTDAEELNELAAKKYKVSFLPGSFPSPTGSFKNCVRLAVANWDEPELIEAARRFCKAYTEYLSTHSNGM